MVYTNPKNLFEQKIQNVMKPEEKHLEIFESIFRLQQLLLAERLTPCKMSNAEDSWKSQVLAFKDLGLKGYVNMLSFFWGKTVTFPTQEEFQESLIMTLCYYYKNVENKDWPEIKEILNMPDLNTIKYGIRVRQLEQYVNQQLLAPFMRCEDAE